MTRLLFSMVLIISTIMFITINNGAYADMTAPAFNLPETFGNWNRSKDAKIINSQNIFKYMNGAGELYLSYGFDHLEVYEFKNSEEADILIEIYLMNSPNDAFGLLSLDWGGEPVSIGPVLSPSSAKNYIAKPYRFLYGAGLLRMAVDSIYVRILSNRETPVARKAILSLGQLISENHKACPEPELLKKLPLELGSGYQLRKDRIGYFRSYLVLNNMYYISHQNILNLNHSTEAIFAPYELKIDSETKKRIQFLTIKYPDKDKASLALEQFHKSYLPEFSKKIDKNGKILKSNSFKIEDGTIAYKLNETYLSILFELPDLQMAESILSQI